MRQSREVTLAKLLQRKLQDDDFLQLLYDMNSVWEKMGIYEKLDEARKEKKKKSGDGGDEEGDGEGDWVEVVKDSFEGDQVEKLEAEWLGEGKGNGEGNEEGETGEDDDDEL